MVLAQDLRGPGLLLLLGQGRAGRVIVAGPVDVLEVAVVGGAVLGQLQHIPGRLQHCEAPPQLPRPRLGWGRLERVWYTLRGLHSQDDSQGLFSIVARTMMVVWNIIW